MSLRRKHPKTADNIVKPRTQNARADVQSVQTDGGEVQIVVPMSYRVPEVFEWDAQKIRVAELVSEGVPIHQIVGIPGMPTSRTTIYQWLKHPDYKQYIDSIIMETGLANQAERMAAMQRVLNKLYDKLIAELSRIPLTDKNAASLIEKFFAGLRQIQEDARGYVQQVHVVTEQTIHANVQANGTTLRLDVEKVLEHCPSEKRALLQKEFADRADQYIRNMTGTGPGG